RGAWRETGACVGRPDDPAAGRAARPAQAPRRTRRVWPVRRSVPRREAERRVRPAGVLRVRPVLLRRREPADGPLRRRSGGHAGAPVRALERPRRATFLPTLRRLDVGATSGP